MKLRDFFVIFEGIFEIFPGKLKDFCHFEIFGVKSKGIL